MPDTPGETFDVREARRLLLLAAGAVDRAILGDPSHPMIQHLNLADTALRMLSDVLPRLAPSQMPKEPHDA